MAANQARGSHVVRNAGGVGSFHDRAREKALELMRSGRGCNQVARETGLSPATVSRLAKANGHSFDRSQTKQMLSARLVDLQEAKMEIAERLAHEVNKALTDIGNAETSQEYRDVARAIADFTRAMSQAEPKVPEAESRTESKNFLTELHEQLTEFHNAMEERSNEGE